MILCTHAVEKYVGLIFTNYDIAYVGKRFSQSFMKWVNMFVQDILNAYNTKTSRYRGSVVSISSVFYYAPNGEIVMYITTISANPIQLAIVRGHTLSERISAGMTSTPPTLTATRRRVSDYSFYCDGGTYYGHPISIMKNNRSNKSKPRFNYYDTVTRNIMFDYEFFSAFPFENNKANAWATDGHKYELPSMLFIESKENNDIIIENKQYNTMKNTRNKVRLTESQLHQVIKESVSKILNEIGNYQPKRKNDPNRYNGGGRADIEGGLPMNFEHDNDDPSEYRDYFGKHEKICEDTDYTWEYDYADKNGKGIGGKHKEPKKNPQKTYYKDGETLPNGFIKKGDYAVHPRLTEPQLHQIVKESINSVLNEAYNTVQYANLAGQANGALNTFGGKIKGLFNPKWKARKQRQEKLFGRGGNSSYNRSGSSAMADNTNNSSYQHDYFSNKYNNDRRGDNPYEIERSQYNMPNAFDIQHGNQDGQTISRQDFRNKYGQNGQNIEGYDDVAYENSKLNNAYQQGRNAAMGKYKDGAKTYGGVRLNGTGTKNGAFQHYGEDR